AAPASTGGLSLNNGGDTVTVRDGAGAVKNSFAYTSALSGTDGVSMNRNPDGTAAGSFVLHTSISSAQSSPGVRASGAPWQPLPFICHGGIAKSRKGQMNNEHKISKDSQTAAGRRRGAENDQGWSFSAFLRRPAAV